MNDLVKWRPNVEIDRRIEEAMEVIRRPPPDRRRGSPAVPWEQSAPGKMVALPRLCSIRNRPWVAYYELGRDGHFRHAQAGIVNKQVYRASFCGTKSAVCVSWQDIEEEMCPYCGTSGSPVICQGCRNWWCRGRVVDDRFSCLACGGGGRLSPCEENHSGAYPSAMGEENF